MTDPDRRQVIVDTDCGIDDALALLFLAHQPDVEISAVTTVYGNCTVDDATLNVGAVLALLALSDVPVARGADAPLQGAPHIAHYVHGRDGLGDVLQNRQPPATLLPVGAADLLVDLAAERPGQHDLLVLGPQTNIALALQREPQLLTRFRSVTVMGGSGPFPLLHRSQMIDANVQNDGPAAAAVFAAPVAYRLMVGVNATCQVVLEEEHVAALHDAGTTTATFAANVLESYLDFYRHAWGRRVCPVHDGLAAGLLVNPEWITDSVTGPVAVTSNGFETRARMMLTAQGEPVAWDVGPTAASTAVTGVDVEAFRAAFLDAIVHAGDEG